MRTHRRLLAFALAAAPIVSGAQPLVKRASATQAPPNPIAAPPSPKPAAPSPPPAPLEKTVLGVDVPTARTEFSVSADGKRSYFAEGSAYYVFDENGDAVGRMPTQGMARTLALLPDGRFISALSHARGHVALLGPDGTELKSLVGRGAAPQNLRTDRTNWTTPTGLAVDTVHQLMFVLDTTVAPKNIPDPDWSRIAVFDTTGKYLRSIALYDGSKSAASDEQRTWYDDIEVDAKRSVLYVTARASRQLWVFNYDGTLVGRAPGVAGIAVLSNGNVAVGDPDRHHVRLYDGALKLLKTLNATGVLDLEADGRGRLYASVQDPTILYLRWPVNSSEAEVVRPRFQQIAVGIPFDTASAGPFTLPVKVTGRPVPAGDEWHVFARPSDGSDLTWKELASRYADGILTVQPPADLRGVNDIAVRYGKGEIARSDGARDLHIEKTVTFGVGPENARISIRSLVNRAGFTRGEAIPLRIDVRGAAPGAPIKLTLERAGRTLASTNISSATRDWELLSRVTRQLLRGHYAITASFDSVPVDSYEFDLEETEPDSPVQRILYHEFDQSPASLPQPGLLSVAERLAFIRDYAKSVAGLGFTRETDRSALKLVTPKAAGTWRAETLTQPGAHDVLPLGGLWEPEFYLDRATAAGIHYDTQLLAHCSGVRLADSWFPPLDATLQRLSQWFGRYPSFYGFNYNDELFFPDGPFVESIPADQAWIDSVSKQLVGRPKADIYRAGLTRMYRELDRAVEEVRPDLARTTTPMWQYPAAEGSYPPTVYAHMTESYSHYLSEGYAWPWYPAHSAEMLRRPGLPVMAVFDNGYATADGELYLKDALQVLGRGVQGIGLQHERPLREPRGADALRTMNELARMYGPIFAEAQPDNEAAVLYSYAQDSTEAHDGMGTPHWERVLVMYGAGLMAGLPMTVAYEEDIAAGMLLDRGKPKLKFLFLVGQAAELPPAVKTALRAFTAAGGTVVIDPDSRELPGAVRFTTPVLAPAQAGQNVRDSDAVFPDTQSGYERIAAALGKQFGSRRRFAVDSNDPWVSKNRFDGGAIHYVLAASETSPYPWDPASLWRLGGHFSKTYWPKRVQLSVPETPVVYDVFERQRVSTTPSGKSSIIRADLTTFPGRLYALAPRVLDSPKLSARMSQESVTYSVNVGIQARVPLRIVLSDGHGTISTIYRGTDLRGEFTQVIARPAGPDPWRLEVSELLGGASSSLTIPSSPLTEPLVRALPHVKVEREVQIHALLQRSRRKVGVVGSLEQLPSEIRTSLLQALTAKGLEVTQGAAPATPSSATYLVLATTTGKGLAEPALTANQLGLFGQKLTDLYPGPDRGMVSAAFSARAYGENCIAIVGGDAPGLQAAVKRFIALLDEPSREAGPHRERPDQAATTALVGGRGSRADIPTLRDRVGIRLSGIRASGRTLALTANGYMGNLAQVEDEDTRGRLVAVARVGESPVGTSLYIANDGRSYGFAARTTQRFGEGFLLANASTNTSETFASFGDGPYQNAFSVAGDANTVLAPGPYGVVAWHRAGHAWREIWSVEYWKQFDALDWPVAANARRVPRFDTLIPKNGDIGLVVFTDLTNGWLRGATRPVTEVSALSLKDGAVRWRFDEPPSGALEAAQLFSNSNGSLVLLQTQPVGASSARFSVLAHGRLVGSWASGDPPLATTLADVTGHIATIYGNGSRLLEVRATDGHVVFGRTWHAQPLAVTFAADGTSVFVSDDSGVLTRLDAQGRPLWQVQLGCSAELAVDGERLYAAGWDGRLRAFTMEGRERWKLDLTEPMTSAELLGRPTPASAVYEATRPNSASSAAPKGVNLLRTGQATLTVGGTRGWKSKGTVQIEASMLTNGNVDDGEVPWLSTGELFWDAAALRKVWVELDLKAPTRIHSLTVYENPKFPESWPTESLIQVWDEADERWRTVKHAVFLHGSRTTYELDLKRAKKLRYVPWGNYFSNFHTSEIELR